MGQVSLKWSVSVSILFVVLCSTVIQAANVKFEAVGPTEPVRLEPRKKGAVEVHFDLLPTSMRFNLPSDLVVWIKAESQKPVKISLAPTVRYR